MVNEKKNDTLPVLLSTKNTDRFYKNKLLSLNLNLLKIYHRYLQDKKQRNTRYDKKGN